MPKLIRVQINNSYKPLKPDIFVKGEVVPFDVYIKKYNDFVIIIEAGTRLDERLYSNLLLNEFIYIFNEEAHKVDEYCKEHETHYFLTQTDVKDYEEFKKHFQSIERDDQKLFAIYSYTAEVMSSIFENKDEDFSLELLRKCTEDIIEVIKNSQTNLFPVMIKFMPDRYSTGNHCTNVAFLSAMLGKQLRLAQTEWNELVFSALVHDIGKIRVNEEILEKPGFYDDEEYGVIKEHSMTGYMILEKKGVDNLGILRAVLHHHERYDGSGYPDGTRGKMIPQKARIIAICDVFDALTTNRTFRQNYSSFEALQLIKEEMEGQFDEKLVERFIQMNL